MKHLLALLALFGAVAMVQAQDGMRVQLHGAVVNAVTHAPLYEVLVEWYDVDGGRQAITQTNSEGRYALFVAGEEQVELRVKENGYKDFVFKVPPFEEGEQVRECDLRLEPK